MRFLLVLAIICAIVAAGFLIATCFVSDGALLYSSIAGGLGLVAFVLLYAEYLTHSKS